MAKKSKPIKWSIGAEEPEDLQEFLSNDEIVAKYTDKKTEETEWPNKGPHRFVVRRVSVKPNRNQDDRVAVMLVLQNKAKDSDQRFNGYVIFDGFNITEQGTPYLKKWLKSIGLTWKDFHSKSEGEADKNSGRTNLTKIGKVKFDGTKDVELRATVSVKPADDFNDDEHLEIRSFLPAEGMDDDSPTDDGEKAAKFDEPAAGPTREEQEAAIKAELEDMDLGPLQKRAKRNDKKATIPDKKKKVIALILQQELPPF